MHTVIISRCIFALTCLASNPASASDDPLAELKKGQPGEVARLIDRLVGCNHWSGEEPYDAERRKEISRAMAALQCDRLSADEVIVLRRYSKKPGTIKALKKAKEMYL